MSPDAFARIADALRQSIAERGLDHSVGDDAAWDAPARNLLLDACGSDHRPLVELVLSVGAAVRPPLRVLARHGAPTGIARWERERAPLVHAVVSSRFLQPDVARWAVDAWAVALGVAPRDVLVPPVLSPAERAHTTSPLRAPAPHAPAHAQAHTPAHLRTHAVAPASHVAGQRGASYGATGATGAGAARGWAGARHTLPAVPVNTRQRIGTKWPTGQRPPTPFDPRLAQRVRRIEKAAVIVLALLVSGVMALLTKALSEPRTTQAVPVVESPTGVALRGQSVAMPSPMAGRVARVARVAAGVPQSSDAALDTLHDEWLASDGFGSADAARAAVARGVAGDYRVAQRVRSVDGSPSCLQVAQALARPLSTLEHIDHQPGASRMSLSSRRASGTIDATGYFTLGPREGTTNGVRWRFVMQGRFHPEGFTGESRTETFAVIRWGRTQSCIAVAELVGRRAT